MRMAIITHLALWLNPQYAAADQGQAGSLASFTDWLEDATQAGPLRRFAVAMHRSNLSAMWSC
ncbi:exported hypothetical protein [Paraburkholderia ribeironis]|uniref:Uncharacterized protein n=1 Tax=Paraburkholderia ribeironis TaxID=1247936 RepID=A0A1N7RJE5_9BURK|nr:exported hypothetical protein [Paraburkholderia ribeironis]